MPVLTDWVSFHFPPKIHLEVDCGYKIGNFIREISNRVIIINSQAEMENPAELSLIKSSIENSTDGVILYDDIETETTYKNLDTAAYFARQAQANCIVAYGGYESINAAKAVSVLATNDFEAEEMIRGKKPVKRKALPVVIIPTMPLMGLECSPFITVMDQREKKRQYFSHISLFPELVIADAKISLYMTQTEIAKMGTAILAASVDTMLSKYANEITSASTLRAIELTTKNLLLSYRDPKNLAAKNMLYAASLLTGISQSVSSLSLCFALSLAASSLTRLDVFQSMSILLTHVMDYNLTSSANKYVMIARALDEDISDISIIEAAIKAVDHIRKIYKEIKVPLKLSEFEVKKIGLPAIASLASSYKFLENMPRELPKNEIETILLAAF
ncbi:MAG: iron-containing alcohol dehydrogenase [Leptospiraceae bacterium]|nr:iron-containing alcohol dehydrogenase [Leptospiraceae bacterium]